MDEKVLTLYYDKTIIIIIIRKTIGGRRGKADKKLVGARTQAAPPHAGPYSRRAGLSLGTV